MDKNKNKLVNGLTTETTYRIHNFDRHVAMSELKRLNKQSRIERVVEWEKFIMPWIAVSVVVFVILTFVN
jgi:hypothetical protein